MAASLLPSVLLVELFLLKYSCTNIHSFGSGNKEQNIIMWMDHRAAKETEEINSTQHPSFKYVGGKVSIEMQLPKLLWLKKNIPDTWKDSGKLMDLPDFLTWRATRCDSRLYLYILSKTVHLANRFFCPSFRSQCSVVCKWNYIADETGKVHGWSEDLLKQIGLEELLNDNARRIGKLKYFEISISYRLFQWFTTGDHLGNRTKSRK